MLPGATLTKGVDFHEQPCSVFRQPWTGTCISFHLEPVALEACLGGVLGFSKEEPIIRGRDDLRFSHRLAQTNFLLELLIRASSFQGVFHAGVSQCHHLPRTQQALAWGS